MELGILGVGYGWMRNPISITFGQKSPNRCKPHCIVKCASGNHTLPEHDSGGQFAAARAAVAAGAACAAGKCSCCANVSGERGEKQLRSLSTSSPIVHSALSAISL